MTLVEDWRPFRDRHGDLTFNTVAAVDFNLLFIYVLPGYEGSAHDSTLFEFALNTDLKMPAKRWFLGTQDSRFMTRLWHLGGECVTIFRNGGTLRSGKDWRTYHLLHASIHLTSVSAVYTADRLVRDLSELFNLRHAQARNAVERVFGVMKKRFKVLDDPMHYSIGVQAQLMPGLCALHNFLRDPGMEARLAEKEETTGGLNAEEEVQKRQDRRQEEQWEDASTGRVESEVGGGRV
jgi:hypothetical protein